jgi:hypothetical protein
VTLIIAALTASGVVLSADSRQTYRNAAGALRVGSDSATKLFRLTDRCAVAISGRAFLRGATHPVKEAGYFVEKFAEGQDLANFTTREITDQLNVALGDVFVDFEKSDLKQRITDEIAKKGGTEVLFGQSQDHTIPYTFKAADGVTASDAGWIETVQLIVAGIDNDGVGRAYAVSVPAGVTAQSDTEICGGLWLGQTDVICRIVKGWAPEIYYLDAVKEASAANAAQVQAELDKLQYIINWATITLQDAVDFCVLMTRTTESIQRFSDGTLLSPGGIPGVGGDIDVAVLTPKNGLSWLKKKSLHFNGESISSVTK